jgi:hypothetical protein
MDANTNSTETKSESRGDRTYSSASSGERSYSSASSEERSFVDDLFDNLTEHTAKGLVVTRDVLEAVARWLDARAKAVGELATKLSTPRASEHEATSGSAGA